MKIRGINPTAELTTYMLALYPHLELAFHAQVGDTLGDATFNECVHRAARIIRNREGN